MAAAMNDNDMVAYCKRLQEWCMTEITVQARRSDMHGTMLQQQFDRAVRLKDPAKQADALENFIMSVCTGQFQPE